jgi:hypothetical protein
LPNAKVKTATLNDNLLVGGYAKNTAKSITIQKKKINNV